jgi:hypothetical protein
VDSLAMVLLGRHLGPSERLSSLDDGSTAAGLSFWFTSTWGSQPADRREAASKSIVAAVDYWRSRSWLSEDVAAGIR